MNKPIYLLAAVILIALFILTACKDSFSENDIKVEDFVITLQNDTTAVVLDVRNEGELTGPLGMIDGAVHIPAGELKDRVEELEQYRSCHIFAICRSGGRSKAATKFLIEKEFKVKNVWGGMREYRSQGN